MKATRNLTVWLAMSMFLLTGVVGTTNICKGDGRCLVVDDFESYDKTGPTSGDPNALRNTWKDGFSGFPAPGSGSNIMLASMRDEPTKPYLHWDDYHDGEQGLVFYYDNDGNTFVPGFYDWQGYGYQAPKFSEIGARTTVLGIGQDWTSQDIKALSLWFKGNPTRAGSFQENVPSFGKYTMVSDGADIGDVGPAGGPYHDEFHYAYQMLVGSGALGGYGEIIARIEGIEDTNPWAKAGVMMRASLFPDANYVMVTVTPGQGISLQFRDQKRGASTNQQIAGPTAPHWVRLVRDSSSGNFEAWHANDVSGVPGVWYEVPDVNLYIVSTVGMDPNIYVGLCLTSHNASAMCTSVFSDVTITPAAGSALIGPWQNRDIGILSNEPEPMYLALEDVHDNVGVKYHDDPNAALIETWMPWNIDLQDFNAINPLLRLDLIDKVYIGFGDRDNPTTGGSGCVYFDGIRLYKRSVLFLIALADKWLEDGCLDANDWCGFADINRDENVDFFDFAWLAQYWEDTAPVPGQASNPDPNDAATDVSVTADLSWTAGSDAAAHGVYLGTKPTPDANDFQGYQRGTTFDPGLMIGITTYYWRIDEVGLGGETTGDIWSFTTVPVPVIPRDPHPHDGATIDGFRYPPDYIYVVLTFQPGDWDVSYEAFFSDDEDKVTARNPNVSLGAAPDPLKPTEYYAGLPLPEWTPYNESLVRGTTYYWCADETDSNDFVWPGDVWSFYVGLEKASNPNPVDDAINISYTPMLSWAAGVIEGYNAPHIHRIYFGFSFVDVNNATPSSSEFWGTQEWVDTDWEPVADGGLSPLEPNTDYYWRIDEAHGSFIIEVIIGDVWSFTTDPSAVPTQASNPSPADMAAGVSITADLSWTAGSNATSHDVYFGTDPTPDASEFQGNQTNITFDLGTLDYETTYYWRIDEVGPGGTTTGLVWRFTTEALPLPGQASNPSPADMAADVSINADLSWTAGSNATSHDVYFGTDVDDVNNATTDSNEYMDNQTGTTFDPGTLDYEITYYWRIDEVGLGGTTKGLVWRFTTEAPPVPGQATNPSPADTATDVNETACLSWTAGQNTTSHDVYLGTNPIPEVNDFQGNQTGTTFCPTDNLKYKTTYYWRIDEKNAYNTTTGEVWSFTTMYDPNLVGWWKFDETSGSIAYDSSGNEHHGMLIDGIGDGLVWVPAEGALNFDGSNNLSRVMIPTSAMRTTAGTIAIWANLAEPQMRGGGRNGSGYFFGCDNGGNNKILLYMDSSDTHLDVKVGNRSDNSIITLSTETWYHIALTWDAGTYAVYVNGLKLDTGSYGGLTSLPSTADIGNNGSSSAQSFHGLMGDVQVYDRSLSAAEIP